MRPEGLDRLTEKQRECLRLVYAHKETKEIARILGLSPDGVNQRIKTAMRILGVLMRWLTLSGLIPNSRAISFVSI